jgi:ferritin-like metal-binding protein YciE
MKNLNDLFVNILKDMYHGEKQILRALPKMSRAANDPELKKALETHREETVGQVERLEKIFEMMDRRARGEPCEAVQGLVEEAKEVMEAAESEAIDAGLVAAAQAVEHYEIARYGTLKAWARQLGMRDAEKLLAETLAEEKTADELLSKLALGSVNAKAA